MARVFITGASGLVGGALLARLRERGEAVTALARSDAAVAAVTARGADAARGDVLDEDALTDAMRGCDLVYHLAGINTLCPHDPAELLQVNVRGAETAVRAAARAGVRRVVLTSSSASLGEAKGTVGSEDTPHRGWYLSVYERSKREGEVAALAAARREGVELVSVNPSSVQGPGRAGGTGKIMIAFLNGRLRAVVDTTISLVDIRDCVEGHLLAAERGRPGERYVLSSATLTLREALAIVSGMTGLTDRPRFLPAAVASAAATVAEAGFRLARRQPPVCRAMVRTMLHGHRYDGSRAQRELGLRYTPVEDTFAATIDWAIAQGLVQRALPAWAPGCDSSEAAPGTPKSMERSNEDPPARAEQIDSGFAEGVDRKPDPPEENLEPDFARGVRQGPEEETEPRGRFSTGAEQLPDTPDKHVERRFSEGIEEHNSSE